MCRPWHVIAKLRKSVAHRNQGESICEICRTDQIHVVFHNDFPGMFKCFVDSQS